MDFIKTIVIHQLVGLILPLLASVFVFGGPVGIDGGLTT